MAQDPNRLTAAEQAELDALNGVGSATAAQQYSPEDQAELESLNSTLGSSSTQQPRITQEELAVGINGMIKAGKSEVEIRDWINANGFDGAGVTGLAENITNARDAGPQYDTSVQFTGNGMDEATNASQPETLVDLGDGNVGAFSRGVIDTATFGFADEIGGVLDNLVPGAGRNTIWNSGIENWGDLYAENRDINRAIMRNDEVNHFGARIGGQVAGAFVPGLGAIGTTRNVANGGRAVVSGGLAMTRPIATATAEGALYGLGSGQGNLLERGDDMVAGGAGGLAANRGLAMGSRMLRPVVGNATRRLLGQGVELTPGEIGRDAATPLGRTADFVENQVLGRFPSTAGRVADAQENALDTWRRAEIRDRARVSSPDGSETLDIQDTVQGMDIDRITRSNIPPADMLAGTIRAADGLRRDLGPLDGEAEDMMRSLDERLASVTDAQGFSRVGGGSFRPGEIIDADAARGLTPTTLTNDASRILSVPRGNGNQVVNGAARLLMNLGAGGLGYASGGPLGALVSTLGPEVAFSRPMQRLLASRMTNGIFGKNGQRARTVWEDQLTNRGVAPGSRVGGMIGEGIFGQNDYSLPTLGDPDQ